MINKLLTLIIILALQGCCCKNKVKLNKTEQRVLKVSKSLLNKPYEANSTGEGKYSRYNQKPIYINTGFDCQTFIEYVLANANSNTPEEFEKNIRCVKYKDCKVSYHTRNHFFTLDWIRNNTKNGFITDITLDFEESKTTTKVISKKGWANKIIKPDSLYLPDISDELEKEKRVKELKNIFSAFKDEKVIQGFIPSEKIDKNLVKKLPKVFLLGIARENKLQPIIGTEIIVMHVGIGVREGNKLYLVHASSESKKIVKVDLIEYFKRSFLQNPNSGMIVLKINEQ